MSGEVDRSLVGWGQKNSGFIAVLLSGTFPPGITRREERGGKGPFPSGISHKKNQILFGASSPGPSWRGMQPVPVPSQNEEGPQPTLWQPKRRWHTSSCSPWSRSRKGHTCRARAAHWQRGRCTRDVCHRIPLCAPKFQGSSPITLEGCTAWVGPLLSPLRFGGGEEGGRELDMQGEGTEVPSQWSTAAENASKGREEFFLCASLPPRNAAFNTQ